MVKTPYKSHQRLIFTLLFFIFLLNASAQSPRNYNSTDISLRLKKLNILGSVLYVAAHPDDENTSAIAYFANGELLRTGYLSATRGDGGQNLIGPEIREGLGLIRTQELLAARRIDHGEQFFSRAVDFGYSKHPDETFNKWNKVEVLSDFVKVFRQFRPDVVITRFNMQPGVTHGHHTASAILANEAFQISGDSSVFKDQLNELDPWQPSKIIWNTSWWFYQRSGQEFDTVGLNKINVGAFSPFLGKSFTEISAQSRSMHKSQGFGTSGSRGNEMEYFTKLDRSPMTTSEVFEGIDISWNRVSNSEQVQYFIDEANKNYDPARPHLILDDLLAARKALIKLPDQYWKEVKLKEVDELIWAVTGTFIKMSTKQDSFSPGDSIAISGELINRSSAKIILSSVHFNIGDDTYLFNLPMEKNQSNQMNFELEIPHDMPISQPYWLREEGTDGMFKVSNSSLIGKPENPPALYSRVTLKVYDQFIDYEIPILYNSSDPVEGEIFRPIHITPPVMVSADQGVLLFGDATEKQIKVNVTSGKSHVSGSVYLQLPKGWKSKPEQYSFNIHSKGEQQQFTFSITPSRDQGQFEIAVVAEFEGQEYRREIKEINYDHFPPQRLYPEAIVSASKIDLMQLDIKIGYIMGAGDLIPQNLEQVGFDVSLLEENQVTAVNLKQYDAIVLGVRAFNTVDWLANKNQVLFDYVKGGGNLIVQYNTNRSMVTRDIAPFKLTLSRDRVTVEESEVRFLDNQHPVLNFPNKISEEDFKGWVQERGLYFPGEWSDELKPILSMNDPGEAALDGSLLVGKHGDGHYIYTGLSFFRELPAGVPGAYRLFINLISIGNNK